MQNLSRSILIDSELNGHERHIVNDDAAFLHRSDEKVLISLSFEDGSEQLDQGRTSDRGLEIEPSAVRRDAHIEIAAERRIPKVDGWRPFARRFLCRPRDGVKARLLCFFRLRVAHLVCQFMHTRPAFATV